MSLKMFAYLVKIALILTAVYISPLSPLFSQIFDRCFFVFSHPYFNLNKMRDVATDRIRSRTLSDLKFSIANPSLAGLAASLLPPSFLRYSIALIVIPPLSLDTFPKERSLDDRYSLCRIEGLLARSLPTRVRKRARSQRSGEEDDEKRGKRRGGENDIYYHPFCHEYHCGLGWLGATRIPSSSEEEETTARGRAELFGGKRGERVKRLTVCYHGNATPLRQEESLNPARYGPCRLSQYTPSTAFSSPRKSKGRRTTRTTKGLRKGERRREDERRVDGDGGDRITPLTLFLHPSVFTERFRYTGYVA